MDNHSHIEEIYAFEDITNRDYSSVLLVGDSDTGKTLSILFFLKHLIVNEKISPQDITLLDFGPPRFTKDGISIGGKVADYIDVFANECPEIINVRYVLKEEKFRAPRSDAKNSLHLLNLCFKNWQKAREHIKKYEQNPTKVLIINDLSIYLHMGSLSQIKRVRAIPEIFFANAYSGKRLLADLGSNISSAEIRLLKKFSESMNHTYKTTDKFNSDLVRKFKKLQ
jgi:hypothetical protein